jgi:D-3-phosphoglycerate dehydrogenase
MKNVILTPHTAGMPDGLKFHKKRYAFFRENITRLSQGMIPLNALNRIT